MPSPAMAQAMDKAVGPNVTHLSVNYCITDAKGSILKKDSVNLKTQSQRKRRQSIRS